MNNASSLTLKYLLLIIVRLLGIYIILFAMCFYAHVNESNIIVNRADALFVEIARDGKSDLVKVASVQNMTRKSRPIFFDPYSIYNSLFGERVFYKVRNKMLSNAIENYKYELADIFLGAVDLEDADLSRADLHGSDFKKANLSRANLKEANLITSRFNLVNFQEAKFLKTKVYRADFSDAILIGADFSNAEGLNCEQIKSAVIDESTVLPDYISLQGSSGSEFKCVNLRKDTGMNLSGINLSKAHLRYSNLRKSDLSHANFQGSKMIGTSFHVANIAGADLRGADLGYAAGLTCEQIKSAVIDENTRLPDYISLECENTVNEN
jgi:uncharacterized protein YjbI with pentapeptide repeats